MHTHDIYKALARSNEFDERRSRYTVYVSWIALPVVVFFPLINDYSDTLAAVTRVLLGVIIILNLILYTTSWTWGQRAIPALGISVAMVALLYFVYLGYGQGASVMWIFVFPLLAMFMTGALWGLISSAVTTVVALFLMTAGSDLGGYSYSFEFVLRFGVSFLMVTALAFGFEYWRVSLELQKEQIDEELLQTRSALAGLTNVCSWCNSIRTESDDWISLESYVSSKEDTEVSHSICSACAEKQKSQLEG